MLMSNDRRGESWYIKISAAENEWKATERFGDHRVNAIMIFILKKPLNLLPYTSDMSEV